MPPKNKKVVVGSDSSDDSMEFDTPPKKKAKSPTKRSPVKQSPPKKKSASKRLSDNNPGPSTENADNAGSDAEIADEFRIQIDDADLLNMEIPPKPEPCMSADGTGSRLMIREIVATNFKSYYGTQRIGPFHKNFSAIIGPNGSGKSNVIDSLLFVFGFRANKIRLKRLAELIHNSSGKKRPTFCTVEITFQKIIDSADGEFEIIPNSVFTVARTAYDDNTSKYTIDGKTRTIKDVVKKLREVGIDLVHNRFLILQGEVEQIAMMQPKAANPNQEGMLEYLEDIIGSSRFKEPIDKLAGKLEVLSVHRSQQTQKVKMADKEVQSLQGPVSEMLTFLRTENNIALLKNKLYHMKLHKFQKELTDREEGISELTQAKEELDSRLKKLLEDRKSSEKEVNAVETEKNTLQKELDFVEKTLNDLEAKETRRKIDLKKIVKDISSLQNNIAKENVALKEIDEIPEKAAKDIELYEGTLKELEEVIKENEGLADHNRPMFEKKSGPIREEKQKIEEEFGLKQKTVDEISSKVAIAKQEVDLLVSEDDKIRKRINDIKTQLESNKTAFEDKKKEFDEAKEQLPIKEKELLDERKKVPELKSELDKLNAQVHSLRGKVADESAFLNSKGEGNRTIKYLQKHQDEGALEGYHGRLGDLGAIDAKYDAAISTTVPQLNYHVVEAKEGAMKAIDLLIKGGIGRTNFMIVNQVSAQVPDSAMNRPANHFPAPRLFDLINIPKPAMKKVFYSAIRDTLVVSDLAEAKQIASEQQKKGNRQRYRFVTLNGSVMEANGAITGGGKPKRGLMGNEVKNVEDDKKTRERLQEMNKEIEEKNSRIQELNDESRQADQKIFHYTSACNKLKERVRVLNNEIPVLKDKIANLQKSLDFQEEQAKTRQIDEDLINAKRETLEKLTEEKKEAVQHQKKAKTELDEVTERLEVVWKELCGRYSEKAEEARKRLDDTKQDIAKAQSRINSNEWDKKKVEKKLKSLIEDLEKKKKTEAELNSSENEFETEITKNTENRDKLTSEIKEMETKIKELRSSYSHMHEEEAGLQKNLIDLTEKLEQVQDQANTLKANTKAIKKEISVLKLHDMKQYDVIPKKVRSMTKDHFLDQSLEMEGEEILRKKEQEAAEKANDSEGDGAEGQEEDVDALPELSPEELKDVNKDDLLFNLDKLERRIADSKKNINMNILTDYQTKLRKYESELDILENIKKNYNDHGAFLENLKKQRMGEFMEGFERIGLALKEMYQMITLGGDAALDLKDSMDPFSEGIQFMVRPPKKSWKNIENLSGGEKTLSSLALVFALHHYRPTPLYVMDEIDAALDFRNVSIIGHYVKDRTKNAQFIIISLRNNMFELGDRLIGIYKTHDCTKNVVIDPQQIMTQAKQYMSTLDKLHDKVNESISNKLNGSRENDENQEQVGRGEQSANRKRVSNDVPVGGKKLDDRASPNPLDKPRERRRRRSVQDEIVQ